MEFGGGTLSVCCGSYGGLAWVKWRIRRMMTVSGGSRWRTGSAVSNGGWLSVTVVLNGGLGRSRFWGKRGRGLEKEEVKRGIGDLGGTVGDHCPFKWSLNSNRSRPDPYRSRPLCSNMLFKESVRLQRVTTSLVTPHILSTHIFPHSSIHKYTSINWKLASRASVLPVQSHPTTIGENRYGPFIFLPPLIKVATPRHSGRYLFSTGHDLCLQES
ncbi:uncharacterized protein G2W53_041253 [Senna tora]|uniref:Uncharacterized protein n=1 Tax=Senna tora TaxID=362788 RepID=A0A834SJP1_9FABA|nr:uncharacterized protein G2W53_041253 [Senna tora]